MVNENNYNQQINDRPDKKNKKALPAVVLCAQQILVRPIKKLFIAQQSAGNNKLEVDKEQSAQLRYVRDIFK